MLNLDTPVLLHALGGRLTPRERRILEADAWSISGIVLWEIAKLAQLGRIELDLDDVELTRVLARLHVWSLTLEICREIANLDVRVDPADELIASTSIVHRVPLLTRDKKLLRSSSIPFAE